MVYGNIRCDISCRRRRSETLEFSSDPQKKARILNSLQLFQRLVFINATYGFLNTSPTWYKKFTICKSQC